MRKGEVYYSIFRGEVGVLDADTGVQVFSVDLNVLSDAMVEGLDPTNLEELTNWVASNYGDVLYDMEYEL